MEKVKITPEQAKEIEEISEGSQPFIVSYHAKGKLAWEHLSELSLDELIRALYIGYEVEPEFKVGDWVVYKHNNTIWEIIGELYGGKVHYDITRNGKHMGSVHKDHIRLATPEEIAEEKERRWWKKHGRDVWELRKGDVLREELSGLLFIVEYTENNTIVHFEDTDFDDYENVRNGYKIICFAENRLDREGGE